MSTIINLIDEERRKYIYASIMTGAVGSLITFILLLALNETQEPMALSFCSTMVGTLMLAFMNMSGFKAK
jgi:hypothetical protein